MKRDWIDFLLIAASIPARMLPMLPLLLGLFLIFHFSNFGTAMGVLLCLIALNW